jgi:hypothetical protein
MLLSITVMKSGEVIVARNSDIGADPFYLPGFLGELARFPEAFLGG